MALECGRTRQRSPIMRSTPDEPSTSRSTPPRPYRPGEVLGFVCCPSVPTRDTHGAPRLAQPGGTSGLLRFSRPAGYDGQMRPSCRKETTLPWPTIVASGSSTRPCGVGEQSPARGANQAEKIEVARALAMLGVDIIEAGFPISSPGDFEAVRGRRGRGHRPGVRPRPLQRPRHRPRPGRPSSMQQKPRIHVFLATSAIHREHKLLMTHMAGRRAGREPRALQRAKA